MSKIIIELEAKALIPTLDVYRQYFDEKYPCTDESNDGSEMPLEDEIKYATYNHLLSIYQKSEDVFKSEYAKMKEQVAALDWQGGHARPDSFVSWLYGYKAYGKYA